MWKREDLSDVKLCCDQIEYNVHKCLLAACSPYFRSIFKQKTDKKLNIRLENVASDDLRRVLLYMYQGSVHVQNDDVQGFCELLEMFWMPLPSEIDVSCGESDSQTDDTDEYTEDDGSLTTI